MARQTKGGGEQPWHFDRHAVLFKEVGPDIKPSDIQVFELPLWVRIYNMPLKGRLNIANVEKLGNKPGEFVRVDNSTSMGIDKSLRVRVKIDVRKPLHKSVKIKRRGGMEEHYEVKYELPPLYCYFCRKMGHGVKDCDDCKEIEEPTCIYGEGLKVSPWKTVKPVEGDGGALREQRCAKVLFVTKPKERRAQEEMVQPVREMVEKLDGVEIQDMLAGEEGGCREVTTDGSMNKMQGES